MNIFLTTENKSIYDRSAFKESFAFFLNQWKGSSRTRWITNKFGDSDILAYHFSISAIIYFVEGSFFSWSSLKLAPDN